MFIYGLIDPRDNELRYIGFTSISLKRRLITHLSPSALKKNTHKNNWVKSILYEKIKPEIFLIQKTDKENWEFDEQWNIQYFKAIGCRLTNECSGGRGFYDISDAIKKKMSDSHKGAKNSFYGKKHTEESKRKISMFHTGRKLTKEHIEKVRASSLGRIMPPKTEEWKRKQSESHKKLFTPELRKKYSDIHKKINHEMANKIFEKYWTLKNTQTALAESYGVSRTVIYNIVNQKHGYELSAFNSNAELLEENKNGQIS